MAGVFFHKKTNCLQNVVAYKITTDESDVN